jgi:hypothetical protein
MGGRQLLTMAVCALVLIAASITLPSTAEAWHWSLADGWDFDSYAECMDYYAANPPVPNPPHYYHFTADGLCAVKKAEEDEKRRAQAEMNRVIVLSCRATSVSDAQFAACVALMTPPVPAAPAAATAPTAAQQLALLRQAIPDYDQVRDPVIRWVNTDTRIPEDLRNTYKRVVEQGDVSEITDLVNRWREATGGKE